MMPFNHMLTKCTVSYKPIKAFENNNHLMYIDDIKLFVKNLKRIENPNTNIMSRLYRLSLPVNLLGYILYWHGAFVYRF